MALFFALFYTLILFSPTHRADSELTQDKQALLAFLSQVPHETRLQWNSTDSPCNWVGVACDAAQSSVYYLRLPGVGLVGYNQYKTEPTELIGFTDLRLTDTCGSKTVWRLVQPTPSIRYINRPTRFGNRAETTLLFIPQSHFIKEIQTHLLLEQFS